MSSTRTLRYLLPSMPSDDEEYPSEPGTQNTSFSTCLSIILITSKTVPPGLRLLRRLQRSQKPKRWPFLSIRIITMIFEAFTNWRHYLEGSTLAIDVVTNHKNLVYFSTTKLLTRWQAQWSKFLSQFNLVIRFRPGKLGAKPDALTRCLDVYPKEGDSNYARVNPQNLRPVFTNE